MSNAIVLNTLNGAVSEYSGFDFHSITSTHAGSATGLYALGGNIDILAHIVADVRTGVTLTGATLKNFLDNVYFSMTGSGTSTMTVYAKASTFNYTFPVRNTGVSRAAPGRGIRENYLAFGYRNTNGADFKLDRIEVMLASSKSRRA